jgi:hypothetical protein
MKVIFFVALLLACTMARRDNRLRKAEAEV